MRDFQSHLKIRKFSVVIGLWLLTTAHAHAETAFKSRYDAYLEKEFAACGDIHKQGFMKESVAADQADEHWSFRRLTEYFLKRRQTTRAVADFMDRFKTYVEDPEHKFNQDDLMKFNELEYALKQKLVMAHGVCLAEQYGVGENSGLGDKEYSELSDKGYEARTADTDKLFNDKNITAVDITTADSFPIYESIYRKRKRQPRAEN